MGRCSNYRRGADWNGQDGNVTTVGSAGLLSESFYGTSDQGGDVWEWNETSYLICTRSLSGGSWFGSEGALQSFTQAPTPPDVLFQLHRVPCRKSRACLR